MTVYAMGTKAVIRSFIEEVINTGDTSGITSLVRPEYQVHNEGGKEPSGIEGARAHVKAVRNTFPELQVSIEDQFGEGDVAVARIIIRATHRGTWLGLEPSNKPVKIHAVNIDRLRNGQIIEHRGTANTLEALIDAAALPVAGE